MARGLRISFNLHGCEGPLTVGAGLYEAVDRAFEDCGMTILGKPHHSYPDDSANIILHLAESHFVGGTYPKDKHFEGTLSVCFESGDNSDKLWTAFGRFVREMRPTRGVDISEIKYWESR